MTQNVGGPVDALFDTLNGFVKNFSFSLTEAQATQHAWTSVASLLTSYAPGSKLTVDGTTLATLSDVQNNARTVGAVRMGTMNVKAGAAGTLFFDEFVSRRTGPIPPNP